MKLIKKGRFWTLRSKSALFMSVDIKQALDKLSELKGVKNELSN